MGFAKSLSLMLVTCCLLAAQDLPVDPVMKARTQRAKAQGLNEADLPPVPRGVTEPPPLPPPETHRKDTRAGRLASRIKAKGRRGRHAAAGHHAAGGHHAAAGQPEAPRAAKAGKHPKSAPARRAAKPRKKRKA